MRNYLFAIGLALSFSSCVHHHHYHTKKQVSADRDGCRLEGRDAQSLKKYKECKKAEKFVERIGKIADDVDKNMQRLNDSNK